MKGNNDKKVLLHKLLFTNSWEDPALDMAAFGARQGARLATVASGACNSLAFLLSDPSLVFSFDYNPHQIRVLELKKAAFKTLDYGPMLELMGVRPSRRREALFRRAQPELSAESRAYWSSQKWLAENGLLNGGRYERFVGLFNIMLKLVQGSKRIRSLFEERNRNERLQFYQEEWDHWRWRLLFKIFFNKTFMSLRGLSADYFHFDDGSSSFAESFSRRTRHALVDLPVRDNYFMSQYTMGRYLSEEFLPEYLLPDNFETIRQRIDRIEAVVGDIRDVFDRFEPDMFDGICLSNVFEMMSQEEADRVLPGVARVLKPGGAMTLRNLMIPRAVPEVLGDKLVFDEHRSRELHQRDRSFAYRSFQVYTRR